MQFILFFLNCLHLLVPSLLSLHLSGGDEQTARGEPWCQGKISLLSQGETRGVDFAPIV